MTGDACREVGFGAGLLEMTSFGSLCARPNGSHVCLLTVGDRLRLAGETERDWATLSDCLISFGLLMQW